MAGKSRFAARLTGDHRRLAELAEEDGDLIEAARHWARAKEFRRALELAGRAGSTSRAIGYAFKAALGPDAAAPQGGTARQAGNALRASGMVREAMILFELGSAYSQAADAAAELERPLRAAELYEKAGEWGKAASCFEAENRLADAVRMLGLRSRQLQKAIDERRPASSEREKREVDDRRAGLLARLRSDSEAPAIDGQPSTTQSASVLERTGRWREAFEAYLTMNDADSAADMVARIPSLSSRQRAELLGRCGRHEEAARALIDAGLSDDAARLLEKQELWSEAGAVREDARDFLAAGSCYQRAGELKAAARCFKKGGDPSLAADAFSRLGRHSEAVTLYLQAGKIREAATALQRNDQHIEAAKYFIELGARAEAIAALEQVSTGSEEWIDTSLKLVPMLLDDDRAAAALDRVRQISDDPREVGEAALERLYWEGRCLEALARGADAVDCYRQLHALTPEHRDIEKRLAEPPPPAPPATLAQGGILGNRYRIGGEIGRGEKSRVYRAYDEELREQIALKVLLHASEADPEEESRLIREVRICRRITHPNLVGVFDVGRFDQGLFVTMELLEGRNLAAALAEEAPLPFARCKRILADVLEGLKEAHAGNLVHRDLKPRNLFLTSERTKILDLGIARRRTFETGLTQSAQAMGTPAYAAPEQLLGKPVDARTDLYSLGVVVYEMLTGHGPFEADDPAALAMAHVNEPPRNIRENREGLPEAWGRLVHRLLAKEPDLRLQSAAHALNVVQALPDG